MNTKVKRMLNALAIVLKDENVNLIEAMDKVINDKRDGYSFDFATACTYCRALIKGKSY